MAPHLLERFQSAPRPAIFQSVADLDWMDWRWQLRSSLKTQADFQQILQLSDSERLGFQAAAGNFKVATTPYYAGLMSVDDPADPLRLMTVPTAAESLPGLQSQKDPLGERSNQVGPRLIHRYSDRVLFWVTDTCGIYCRYCTRKHFTAKGQAVAKNHEVEQALDYIQKHDGVREVILSGGDPLTVSDEHLEALLARIRQIPHVELIRIGSRLVVANPFRITVEFAQMLRRHQPVVFMSHFNHPRELTRQALQALSNLVDHGVPVFNQMVLLNGVNNHPAIVHALSRKLLLARVKPYYMFQCDPSVGTDHLRTSFDQSLWIQKEMWGHVSGLAMPNLALDIPSGGGKACYVPSFETANQGQTRQFKGWDGVQAEYISPDLNSMKIPADAQVYAADWESVQQSRATGVTRRRD